MQDSILNFEDHSYNHPSETLPQIQEQKQKNPSEAKNIPKNIGGLLKNHFVNRCFPQVKDNKVIKHFISLQSKKKNYSREDIKKVLENKEAANIAKKYFASFEIIEDILHSEKVPEITTLLKYIRKFFIASYYPETLSTLKLPE
ncbi:unnamed protein product [Paramecium primaurelia]|uniref:Uncharacterized protein n=2 Tax=Paramecium TaxID=5884 RepID=A0A8S1VYZ5_9CILI|nr:unnamed protein product [Paramecium primaurelia]CAD8182904.1 unnamed protein product [Paramecium pentaurelia]